MTLLLLLSTVTQRIKHHQSVPVSTTVMDIAQPLLWAASPDCILQNTPPLIPNVILWFYGPKHTANKDS